jgi:exodeoxyribonuclease V alpha subunit
MAETISGIIERVTFHNLDTGFAVLRVLLTRGSGGMRGQITVVGHLPSVVAGEFIEADGEWVQNRDHGLEFKAAAIRATPPHTVAGIEKYLGSGLVKGIGPHFAKKIVEVFGDRTLTVIDESPDFLAEVKGIGAKRLQRIRDSWQEQKSVRSIMVFLQSYGIGTARAVRIYKTYGDRAIELVRENPYRLATDIWGVGFQTADELAGRLGVDRQSPTRARAAVRYVLQELSGQGNVGYPEQGVIEATTELTNIDIDIVKQAIEAERDDGEVVRDNEAAAGGKPNETDEGWLFLKPLFLAEQGVARQIRSLRDGPHPMPEVSAEALIDRIESRLQFRLAESQRAAVRAVTREKLIVVTGGPGTGKTTIVRAILELFTTQNMRVSLCAPTGRAAKRLGELTGGTAKTIHRLLEFDPAVGAFKRCRENPLDLDLLIVDESSMVDIVLMNQLLRAVPEWACVVFVGDVDQLPSVGPGNVLADLIASRAVPVVRLTEIFRQAVQSWIVRAAHAVNQGDEPESAPPGSDGDFYFVQAETPEAILDRLIVMIRERIPARFGLDPIRDVQVLSPMNRSALGVRELNARLQEVMNPPQRQKEIQRFGWTFRVGDKVMQTVNNYPKEVFNGDIGRIMDIAVVDQEMLVEFDGRAVSYDFGELDELSLAYCSSVHKSQGGEYPAVLIPLHTQHFIMLQRNLLYTAITRGKKLVVVVGNRKALSLAVQRQNTSRRFSLLRPRLESPP